ncbi:MAG: trypsin-like peptidase domain-containing protein [Erysipelotrichia bacterium]|nr:trypsin-like peptidase domain-containing protein [Erysipelotrichia bacterium]
MDEQREEVQNENIENNTTETVKTKKTSKKPLILYLAFTIILSTVCSFISVKIALKESKKQVVVYQQPQSNTENVQVSTENDISSIVEKIVNSVVEVYTETVSYSTFYGEYVNEGAGSGVIYSTDGYIITNNHVIEKATSIKVTLTNGEQYDAELIATDNVSDIAVIKINVDNLPAVVLGNSDNLKVGQYCIAIGNPLGTLGGTVTNGIISALSREVTIDGQKMNLLQTNTAINPGNSGGGLFNYNGELIGIVNAKSGGTNIEGIGFAIPINYAATIAKELIEKGYVEGRPQLGIKGTEINSIQQAWNYSVNSYGIYVSELVTDSAKNSGLQIGDIITMLNNEDVTTFEKLKGVLSQYQAGETVELTVARGKDTVIIKLMLEQKK